MREREREREIEILRREEREGTNEKDGEEREICLWNKEKIYIILMI